MGLESNCAEQQQQKKEINLVFLCVVQKKKSAVNTLQIISSPLFWGPSAVVARTLLRLVGIF